MQIATDRFSDAMQSLGQAYVNAINKRCKRVGPLFQGRFQAIHVDREEYLVHLSRYIHLNPLKARLVNRAEKWPYSSYLEYLGMRNGTLPEPGVVLRQFESRAAYQRFVEAGARGEPAFVRHLLFEVHES